MALKVNVLSEPKGSNPGGLCTISDSRGYKLLDGYFKYCHGSQLQRGNPLRAEKQPIYEALSSVCATIFGLSTPNVFVLDNRKKDVEFINIEEGLKDHSGRPFYFVSKLEPNPSSIPIDKKLEEMVERESVYLEALHLGDYNRRQNYLYMSGNVCYLDLGCWRFACANDGFLKDRSSGRIEILSKKELKRLLGRLNKTKIISEKGDAINLAEFVQEIPTFPLYTLNPRGEVQAKELLDDEELYYIQNYLAQGFSLAKHKFEEKGLLLKGEE